MSIPVPERSMRLPTLIVTSGWFHARPPRSRDDGPRPIYEPDVWNVYALAYNTFGSRKDDVELYTSKCFFNFFLNISPNTLVCFNRDIANF
ncbi:2412_t:CDS:2 [Paraglomus occultum]|uniref:2412_t:CDS:1 n=1 Tax=Paraglomus occultum TaxID=144539 RepID=A0A9N9BCG6_9GLOM|nr:2412_t:CDS:2 [Paraglomus occultum]